MLEQKSVPDLLFEVRQKLAALKAEEAALREILIADPSARIGGNFNADIKETITRHVLAQDLKKANPALYDQLAKETVAKQVRLVPTGGRQ